MDLFVGHRDKTGDIVHDASLVIMEKFGRRQVIAFDRHFVEACRQ